MHRILIADDDEHFVEVVQAFLESRGFGVLVANEGVRAVELAHKEKPDVVLLDWRMPAGIGSSVIKNIKARNDTRHIPIIVISGVDESDIENEAMECGAVAFLRKPYDREELIAIINKNIAKEG